MKNETEILKLYVDSDNPRPEFTQPFSQKGNVYATEGHILIRVNQSSIDSEYEEREKPHCSHLFYESFQFEDELSLDDLNALMANADNIEEVQYYGEDIECKDCEGTGEVPWEYKSWEKEFECPLCDGTGFTSQRKSKPTGNLIPNPETKIRIRNTTFKLRYLSIISKTLKLLGVGQCVYKENIKYSGPSFFEINKDIMVLLMPVE